MVWHYQQFVKNWKPEINRVTKFVENCAFAVQKDYVNRDGRVGPSLRPSTTLTPKPMDKVRLNLHITTQEQKK
jgi:hypothetical protein